MRRIEELQARNERKAEKAAITRDELIEILTEIAVRREHCIHPFNQLPR
jgi:hypothetical protein